MTNTYKHAEKEFEILEKTVEDAIIAPFKDEILALVEKFGQSGQSGGSAPFTAGSISKAVKELCLQNPICPITGIDEEWNDCSDMGGDTPKSRSMYQNNRASAIFKDGKDGRPYYLDAIIFQGQNGSAFTSNSVDMSDGRTIGSSQFIRLPFKPKSFYIDVIETEWHKNKETGELTKEEGGGWWTSIIKDEDQLKEVAEYYDLDIKLSAD